MLAVFSEEKRRIVDDNHVDKRINGFVNGGVGVIECYL